jgi:hypothetical protein
MNWDAIGATGESLSAILVLITLIYLATQVRYAKNTAADTNRLARAKGVCDYQLACATNDCSGSMVPDTSIRDNNDVNYRGVYDRETQLPTVPTRI